MTPNSITSATTRDRPRLDVVHVIASLTAGGAERQLEMLTAHSRHRSRVVALYGSGGIADGMRARGHDVQELRAAGWRKALVPLALARQLRRTRPDVVHVHLLSGQLLGIPAARLARAPLVVSSEHSLMEDTIEGRPHTWWLRRLYRLLEQMTTHTIAVSDVTSQRLQRWGVRRDRISVVDLGVDLEALAYDPDGRRSVRDELTIPPGIHVIGAVGRLEPVKRLDVVLHACAPRLRSGAVLVVAGAGPLQDDLQALATELGVGGQVRWLGSCDRMGPVLSAMDVLISASADETFGMAVVEAVAGGLPVVYVTCPALEDLPAPLVQAAQVPTSGDRAADARRLGDAVAARLAATGQQRWPSPASLDSRYGAQAAADRVDATYDRLLADRRG